MTEETRELITICRLKEVITYDKESGEFTWNKSLNSRSISGSKAGYTRSDGYIEIKIDGIVYKAHRLAWFYEYQEWPKMIDHINGSCGDNRICNLRKSNSWLNQGNRAMHRNGRLVGAKYKANRKKKWESTITIKGKHFFLGSYNTEEEAHSAYMQALQALLPSRDKDPRPDVTLGKELPS